MANTQQWFIAPDGSKWSTKEARDSYVRGGMRGSNLLKTEFSVPETSIPVKETIKSMPAGQPQNYFSAEAKAERLRQATIPMSGTTVTARPFEGMTASQREQELLKTAGASEESQRIAGLTQQERFAEELKTAQEGIKQEKEITAMERKIRDQQLRDMVARTERSVAGVMSAYGQSPEGAIASTKGQIAGQFATTQNKAIQTAVENVRIQDMRIESLEKERQRKLDQGAVAAVKDIDAQLENARLSKIQAEQLAQQTEMTARQNATAYIDTLSQSGALAAMSEQDINALIPTIQGLPESVVRSMIQGQLAISEGAEATAKFDLMQKGMQTFLGFAKEGVEMPEGSILSFSQQYGIPAEVLLEFNQKASQIKDKESVEYAGLVDNLNKQLKGWDDKSKRTIDTLAEMYRQGVSPEIISAYKEANNLTDYDDPMTIAKLQLEQANAKKAKYEADNMGKPPPYGTKEYWDYKKTEMEAKEAMEALGELGDSTGILNNVLATAVNSVTVDGVNPYEEDFKNVAAIRGGELGCAYVVSDILMKAGIMDQRLLSVDQMQGALENMGWTKSDTPTMGSIVVWGKDPKLFGGHKHIGIVSGEDKAINNRGKTGPGESSISGDGRPIEGYWIPPEKAVTKKSTDQLADEIMKPYSTLRLSDLTKKQQEKVAPILNKKKEEALQSGDLIGVMKASAGGKDPTDSFRNKMSKAATTIGQVNNLFTFMLEGKVEVEDEEGKIFDIDLSPLTGWFRNKNPWDTDAQTINAALQGTVPNLARGIFGEVGVLTDRDILLYKKTLPNLTQTKDVQKSVAALTMRTIRNAIENDIELNAGTGNDMSGLVNFYQKINDKVNKMEQELGIIDIEKTQQGTIEDDEYLKSIYNGTVLPTQLTKEEQEERWNSLGKV